MLLAVRLSTSCVSKVLAGKPQKEDIFTSCGGLRVLTVQELLAALLARALFLGSTVVKPLTIKILKICPQCALGVLCFMLVCFYSFWVGILFSNVSIWEFNCCK